MTDLPVRNRTKVLTSSLKVLTSSLKIGWIKTGAVFIESKPRESTSTLFVHGHSGGNWEIAAGGAAESPEIPFWPSSSDEVDRLPVELLPAATRAGVA